MSAETQCRFEKALITGVAKCSHAERREIGERLVCFCHAPAAAQLCDRYLSSLRKNLRFVFRQTDSRNSPLSNHQEIRLQCGGLLGLAALTHGEQVDSSFDIGFLLGTAEQEHHGVENIPLDRIVPRIAAYNPRPHRKKE